MEGHLPFSKPYFILLTYFALAGTAEIRLFAFQPVYTLLSSFFMKLLLFHTALLEVVDYFLSKFFYTHQSSQHNDIVINYILLMRLTAYK